MLECESCLRWQHAACVRRWSNGTNGKFKASESSSPGGVNGHECHKCNPKAYNLEGLKLNRAAGALDQASVRTSTNASVVPSPPPAQAQPAQAPPAPARVPARQPNVTPVEAGGVTSGSPMKRLKHAMEYFAWPDDGESADETDDNNNDFDSDGDSDAYDSDGLTGGSNDEEEEEDQGEAASAMDVEGGDDGGTVGSHDQHTKLLALTGVRSMSRWNPMEQSESERESEVESEVEGSGDEYGGPGWATFPFRYWPYPRTSSISNATAADAVSDSALAEDYPLADADSNVESESDGSGTDLGSGSGEGSGDSDSDDGMTLEDIASHEVLTCTMEIMVGTDRLLRQACLATIGDSSLKAGGAEEGGVRVGSLVDSDGGGGGGGDGVGSGGGASDSTPPPLATNASTKGPRDTSGSANQRSQMAKGFGPEKQSCKICKRVSEHLGQGWRVWGERNEVREEEGQQK